jgi:peptide chain release factor 2
MNLGGLFDITALEAELARLEAVMAKEGFWNDQESAQKIVKQLTAVKWPLERYREYTAKTRDALDILELIEDENDVTMAQEVQSDVETLDKDIRDFELRILLSGRYDSHGAIVTLHAGAGGTDAQDWVEMLYRLYSRWAERHNYKPELLDSLTGEEAGLKSVTMSVTGEYAYGFLKSEKGVHRLVRISPFDSSGRRHTSFASVEVMPEIEDASDEVDIKPEELKVDTFRASSAGGQNVNKTDSAVRITHLPTGIIVSCQNERSQHSNRETAMRILKSRILEMREREREKELAKIRGEHQAIEWGSQIRSYVFQPYSLVKDHRTGTEEGNVQAVMDGEIDDFIYSYLQAHIKGTIQPPT